jgi:hypothetical protein
MQGYLMPYVINTITINAPADTIWQVISDFGTTGQYLASVTDCKVEGVGVGTLRTLTHVDGSKIVERLETLDKAAQQLSYSLLTDTPFGSCLTTMLVRALGTYQAELAWSASLQPVGLPASEAAELMEGVLAANCLTLKQFLES